jgi:hypothetical protein
LKAGRALKVATDELKKLPVDAVQKHANVTLLHLLGSRSNIAGELFQRFCADVPLAKVALHLKNTQTSFDIDPMPGTSLLFENDLVIAQVVFVEFESRRKEQGVQVTLDVRFSPLRIAVRETLRERIKIDVSTHHECLPVTDGCSPRGCDSML